MYTRRHLIHTSLAGCAGIAACSSETGPESAAEPASGSKAAAETASAEPPRFDPADLKRYYQEQLNQAERTWRQLHPEAAEKKT